MRKALVVILCAGLVTGQADAAEKTKAAKLVESARAAVAESTTKNRESQVVAADLEQARALLRKAEETMAKGQQWWLGAGEVKPEAEQEILHLSTMIDLTLSQAASRLERARREEELEAVRKELTKVKARLKVFDDRREVMEKLRSEVARLEALTKELAAARTEKAQLAAQVQQLLTERAETDKIKEEKKLMEAKLAELTTLNAKLTERVEKRPAEKVDKAPAEQKKEGRKEEPPALPAATIVAPPVPDVATVQATQAPIPEQAKTPSAPIQPAAGETAPPLKPAQ